jgi:hypothetical protein
MSRFAQIPEIPDDLPQGLTTILQAMKQNLESLAGLRGVDRLSQAVKFGDMQVSDVAQQSTVAAGSPPTKAEFDKAVEDIENLTKTHNYLAAQLRGEKVGT